MTKNWLQTENKDYRKVWKHNKRELYIYLTYSADHYEKDDNDNVKEIMRWKGELKIGTNITVNVYKYSLCDNKSKEEAFTDVDKWRINLMNEFESNLEGKIKDLDIEKSLREYEEYVNN